MKKLLFLTLFFVLQMLLSVEAQACSCIQYGEPACSAYWGADAVFSGIITDIKKPSSQSPGVFSEKALLHFVMQDAYRGISGSEIDIATLSGTSCDIPFENGERLLVYAYRDKSSGR